MEHPLPDRIAYAREVMRKEFTVEEANQGEKYPALVMFGI